MLLEIPGMEPVVSLHDGRTIRLTPGDNLIGETRIVLVPYTPYVPTALTQIPVERIENICSPALLMEHLPLQDHTVEYAVQWADEDKWMVIRAQGNIAGFYADGTLISDVYPDGGKWVIDLRHLKCKEGYIKIQPLLAEDRGTIYMEIPFAAGIFVPEVFVSWDDILKI